MNGGHFQYADFVLNQTDMKAPRKGVRLGEINYVNPVHYGYRHSYYQYVDSYVDSWGYDSGYNFLDTGAVEPIFSEVNSVQFLSS